MLQYKLAALCAKLGTFWTEIVKCENGAIWLNLNKKKVFNKILRNGKLFYLKKSSFYFFYLFFFLEFLKIKSLKIEH